MDQEVAKTLSELELKLQELERELTSIGHRDTQAEPPTPSGMLVDEAVEQQLGSQAGQGQDAGHAQDARENAMVDGDGFGVPEVFGGEELPAQAGATVERDWTVEIRETAYGEIPTPPSPSPPLPPSRPSAEHSTPPPRPPSSQAPAPQPSPATPPGPPPSAPPGAPSTRPGLHPPSLPGPDPRRSDAVEESRSVDLAELVRFRDRLARTMDDLIDEYSRLLPIEPPPRGRPGE